jgi:hypothetical protein
MKRINAIWLCAIIASSALILGVQGLSSTAFAGQPSTSEIKKNISASPEPTKSRMLGAAMFSFAILTTIIIVSREIKLSRPKKEKILSKYYRG